MKIFKFAIPFIATLITATAAIAETPICADRPGSGNAVCTVDPRHWQVETGSDQSELRLGIIPHLEANISNDSLGFKYFAYSNSKFSFAARPSVNYKTGYSTFEIPMQYNINDKMNVTLDPQFIQHDKPAIALAFNNSFSSSITLTSEFSIQGGSGYVNSYVAWIPPKFQSLQIDLGIVKGRPTIGISKRF